jgi:RNA polymerase sigma-70 factor (ECF subfamily)
LAEKPETGPHELSDPETWVERYGDVLFRFAMSRVRDRGTAEELVQETFLAAFRARERFAGRASERTWLSQILRNKIIDHYRRRRREQGLREITPGDEALDSIFNDRGRWREKPASWNPDPYELIEREEFLEALKECLSALPSRQADVFTMRVMDEMGTEEICKLMEVTTTNLGVLLHRARMRLRRCLEVSWFERSEGEAG